VALSERELSRRSGDRIEIRREPVRLRLAFDGIGCADGHQIRATFSCSVQALDRPIEKQALAETFMSGGSSVSIEQVAGHFHAPLRDALRRLSPLQPASHWLEEGSRETLVEALRESGNAAAFACGLELLGPFELFVNSDSLDRQRMEAMQRRLAEQREAGRIEHIQRCGELLKEFQKLRDSAPGLLPGQILERMSPGDRAAAYEASLAAGSCEKAKEILWAVAGTSLIRIDPRAQPAQIDAQELPDELGPLRSVQPAQIDDRSVLLVGARSGVIVFEPDSPTELIRECVAPSLSSQLGFNAAAWWNGAIWATHREAGLVKWDSGSEVPSLIQSPGAANLCLDGQHLLLSTGETVRIRSPQGAETELSPNLGPIAAIVTTHDGPVIVGESGKFVRFRPDGLGQIESRCGPISAAAGLPWMGEIRLLLASRDGPIFCVGLEDSLVTQYLSSHREIRLLAAAADLIAAVSADRQRLVLWQSGEPRGPVDELHIGVLARHRMADICFA
jgi:hypothetical protein